MLWVGFWEENKSAVNHYQNHTEVMYTYSHAIRLMEQQLF